MIALVRLFERGCTCHGPSGSWQRAEGLCVLLSTSEWSSTTLIPQPRPLKGHYFAPYVCRVNLDFHTHTHTDFALSDPVVVRKDNLCPKMIPIPFICCVENRVSWSCKVSGEHCCMLAEACSIPGTQHQSACIQGRLDENTNTMRTHTLTNADLDKQFVFIWFSLKLGKYLPEFKCCLRSSSRSPLASNDRQTWSIFKQPTRPMIRALLHSVGKLNYTGSPLQNNADWNCHLSVMTSCQAERA